MNDIRKTMLEVASSATSIVDAARKAADELGLDVPESTMRGWWKGDRQFVEDLQTRIQKRTPLRHHTPTEPFDMDRFIHLNYEAAREWAKQYALPDKIEISIETSDPIVFFNSSDWHLGPFGTRYDLLDEDNEQIATHPNAYIGVGGDHADNYTGKLEFAGRDAILPAGEKQKAVVNHQLRKLERSGSLLWVAWGNHNGWAQRHTGDDPRSDPTMEGVQHLYIGDGGTVRLRVGGQVYTIWRRHRPAYSSRANPLHAVVQEYRMGPVDFDIGLIEHEHVPMFGNFYGKPRENGNIERYAARMGTYKLHDPHAIEYGYQNGNHALIGFILYPDRFEIVPLMGVKKALRMLDLELGYA